MPLKTARKLKLVLINLTVLVLGFLLLDAVVSITPLVYWLVPNAFRIHDPHLHHSLAKNVDNAKATWGPLKYRVFTNSLGYRDARVRQVKLRSDKAARVLFLGDSFTEAVAMPWDQSFVGRFAAQRPDLEVLNGGVSSYSPSLYFKKAEELLDHGYHVDHVIVYIDISDIQDEALYSFDAAGDVVDSDFLVNQHAQVGAPPKTIQVSRPAWQLNPVLRLLRNIHIVLTDHFIITKNLGILFKNTFRRRRLVGAANAAPLPAKGSHGGPRGICSTPPFCLVRSMWTIDGAKLTAGYGDLGVDGAIAKAQGQMDRLAALLRGRGIGFSVGVYPWPDQMQFDTVDSRQVKLWRHWCARSGCETFINHFPDFFEVRNAQADWLARLYIPGDFHFSTEGNRLLAERLIRQTDAMFRQPH